MVDQVPSGPPEKPNRWNVDNVINEGPQDPERKHELPISRTLEDVIQRFKALRDVVEGKGTPEAIRDIARNQSRNCEYCLRNFGSIPRYEQIIRELEEDIVKHPSLRHHLNTRIQEHRRTIANIERARRVLACAEH